MPAPLVNGPWKLNYIENIPKNGYKVFSCFHCGGGSTMGYKLAGYEVLGGVEIDKQMMAVYRQNHNPKFSYLMGVQEFKNIPNEDLPKELFSLDILDGSPPCSSFSMAGEREGKWGVEKKFREGQAEQVLDNLFFDFIDIAKKLQPKIVVAENVKGLVLGNARGYVKQIFQGFREAGYEVQLFLLNAARMGVPQARERTFFIARKTGTPKIELNFDEPLIPVSKALVGTKGDGTKLVDKTLELWKICKEGKALSSVHPNGFMFNRCKLSRDEPSKTLTANGGLLHWDEPRWLSDSECIRVQTFPDDYNFMPANTCYMCGMSVPPFMTQRIAREIEIQMLGEPI